MSISCKSAKTVQEYSNYAYNSSDFLHRSQVDLIDLKTTDEVKSQSNYCMFIKITQQNSLCLTSSTSQISSRSGGKSCANILPVGCSSYSTSDNVGEAAFVRIFITGLCQNVFSRVLILSELFFPEFVLGSLMRKADDNCWTIYINMVQYEYTFHCREQIFIPCSIRERTHQRYETVWDP